MSTQAFGASALWRPMDTLSYNSTSIARSCWKKFYWKYIEGLDPVTKPINLSLGGIIHEAFDMYYKGATDQETLDFIRTSFDGQIGKVEVTDVEDMTIAKYTALGMWLYYPYKNLKEFQEIYSEEETHIPIGNYNLVVKVDGRVKKNDTWWIRELKTTSLSLKQFEARASTSAQVTGYVYGMRKKGYDIKGVMFEYIKKPLLRKGANEDMHQYGQRIMQDYKDRPKLYYGRHFTYRTENDLKMYEKDILTLAAEMDRRKASGEFYRNPDACWNFNSECPYKKICFQEKPDTLTVELYFTVNPERRKDGGNNQ